MRRPVGPHIGSHEAAGRADHPGTQRPHRHFVRQGVGIHDRAVIAPKRLAVDQKITTAVTADLTESDRRKCLALTRSSCGGFLREAISVATFNLFIRSCDAWARRHAPLPTLRLLLKKWQNVSALETTANEYITRLVNSLDLKNRLSDIETDRRDRLHAWLLRIVAASTASTSMALPSRWRSRAQHQKRPYASQQKKRAGAVSYSITSSARTCHHQLGLQIFHPQPITRLQYGGTRL